MAQLKGRKATVSVSADDTVYNPLLEMNSIDMGLGGNSIDTSVFGDEFIERIQGLRDCSWDFGGFYDPTDTDGQVVVRDAMINDTPCYVKVLFDPTAAAGSQGFKQQVIPTKFNPKAAVADVQTLDCSFDGTGPVTAV